MKHFQSIPQRFHCIEPQASTFLRAVYTSISTCSTNRLEELISCFMRFMLEKKINHNRSVRQKREKEEGEIGNKEQATSKSPGSDLQWTPELGRDCPSSLRGKCCPSTWAPWRDQHSGESSDCSRATQGTCMESKELGPLLVSSLHKHSCNSRICR